MSSIKYKLHLILFCIAGEVLFFFFFFFFLKKILTLAFFGISCTFKGVTTRGKQLISYCLPVNVNFV